MHDESFCANSAIFNVQSRFTVVIPDFLQCLLVALNNGNNVEKSFPSFATYYKRRTESFVKKLVTQTDLRDLVFSAAVDDKKSNFNYQIALMISELDQYASQVFPLSSWSDDWWQDKQVKEFLTSQAN